MEVINIEDYKEKRFSTAIALGNFDGVHIGHQRLVKSINQIAKENNCKSGILLFKNHTKNVIFGKGPLLLTSMEQKLEIFEKLGTDLIYTINFDKSLMQLSPEDFVRKILIGKLNIKYITVGFDYRFGHKASGDVNLLRELASKYDFTVNVIEAENLEETVISSTKIREYLSEGQIGKAKEMLGRNYVISGQVIHGKSLGKKLGFPTANIHLSNEYLLPKMGVYASKVRLDGREYLSVTSIGKNPTFNEDNLKIETHILGFSEEIYGKTLDIEFLEYIRGEIKFDNLEDLVSKIQEDVNFTKGKY